MVLGDSSRSRRNFPTQANNGLNGPPTRQQELEAFCHQGVGGEAGELAVADHPLFKVLGDDVGLDVYGVAGFEEPRFVHSTVWGMIATEQRRPSSLLPSG